MSLFDWGLYLLAAYAIVILPFQIIIWRHKHNEKDNTVNSGAKFG